MKLYQVIIAVLAHCATTSLNGQKTVAANAGMNVLYLRLVNKVDIVSPDIPRKHMEVQCDGFEIKDSGGHFYFWSAGTPMHEARVRIRDKRKKTNSWTEAGVFRVKKVPKPIAQIGTLQPGHYRATEIAIQNTLYAYLDGFVMEGIKYTVISYDLLILDLNNLEIFSKITVKGNHIAPIKALYNSNGYKRMEITNIRAVLTQELTDKTDTVTLYPVTYTAGNGDERLIAQVQKGTRIQLLKYHSTFRKVPAFGPYKVLKLAGKDTTVLAERVDSAGFVASFGRYYSQRPGILKLDVKRQADSTFYVRMFDSSGQCIAEGHSINPVFNLREDIFALSAPVNSYYKLLYCISSGYNLMPTGEWKCYHASGSLFIKGSFAPKKQDGGGWHCVPEDKFYRTGVWQIFDENGNLLQQDDFGTGK